MDNYLLIDGVRNSINNTGDYFYSDGWWTKYKKKKFKNSIGHPTPLPYIVPMVSPNRPPDGVTYPSVIMTSGLPVSVGGMPIVPTIDPPRPLPPSPLPAIASNNHYLSIEGVNYFRF